MPEGVLNAITAQLPSLSQQAARLVCTSWRDNLAVQSVKSNQLSDQELHEICCKYSALKSVDISRSVLLTESSLRPLSKLAGLTCLKLSHIQGGRYSLAGLEALTALRELDVSNMRGTPSALEQVCKLTRLTNLDMSGTPGVTLSLLDGHLASQLITLTNLQCLSLKGIRVIFDYDVKIPDVVEDLLRQMLESLPRLTKVDLGDTGIKGTALQAFQKHRTLQALSVDGCPCLTDLTGLHGLPSLSSLDVHITQTCVDHPSLRCLTALTSLTIGDKINNIATAPLGDITSLTMLRELVLVPDSVILTERSCDALLQLTQLRVLEFMMFSMNLDTYNWHLAPRLFSHPGLSRLRWTNTGKRFYSRETSWGSLFRMAGNLRGICLLIMALAIMRDTRIGHSLKLSYKGRLRMLKLG